MKLLYSLIKPILFHMDPEKAHDVALSALGWMPAQLFPKITEKPTHAMGHNFRHPIGLAAGLDKNAEYLDALAKIGFSFIEVGTVTPKPQNGNPKPRLFRLPEASALINRMGFNNKGVDILIQNIERSQYQGILGINIGKNKDTVLDKAHEDYLICLEKVYRFASYVTINISSPNTPDLRQLQQGDYVTELLNHLAIKQHQLADQHKKEIPLLVKLSPDETEETLKHITDTVLNLGLQGIIATNTTLKREQVSHFPFGNETGGLSGKPLMNSATDTIRILKNLVGNAITLIGVGGIDNAESAQEKLKAGADLLQVYTGLIYKGPGLVSDIMSGFDSKIKQHDEDVF